MGKLASRPELFLLVIDLWSISGDDDLIVKEFFVRYCYIP